MSRRATSWCLFALLLLLPAACQQQMATQPSYRHDQPTSFFPDGRAARPAVAGTVARGYLRTDRHLFAGRTMQNERGLLIPASLVGLGSAAILTIPAALAAQAAIEEQTAVTSFPFPVTAEVLQHGQHRYMIYCVVCHDALGTGRGMVVERGYTPPPSYHIDRLRQVPVGHIFEVITKGYGSMPSYRNQVPPRDRWAIAAYIRALQLSQRFAEKELPADLRREWEQQAGQAGGAGP